MNKALLLFWFFTYSLYSGYQIELPLNKISFISFPAPYINDNLFYKNQFPYYPSKNILSNTRVAILDAIDINLSDNNLSDVYSNKLPASNIQKLDTYSNDISIEVSHFDIKIGSYLRYSSKNNLPSSNTLTHFESGKGYYVKVVSSNPNDKVGIIADANFRLSSSERSIPNAGWHMVGLNDDLLSKSSSGLFIPYPSSTNFSLSKVNGEYGFNVSFDTSSKQSARNINHQVRMQRNKGYPMYIVAYPAQKIVGTSTIDGVLVISDTLMETDNPSAISISNRPISFTKRSLQEYMVAFKFSDSSHTYPSKLSVINMENKEEEVVLPVATSIDNHLQNMEPALKSIANNANSYGIYKIDGDFNATSTDYKYALLALDREFGIKEKLVIRSYKKLSNTGKFQVVGKVTRRVNKISDISSTTNSTKVYLVDKGSTFDIVSNEVDNISVLEEGSTSIDPIKNTSKGYITNFYKDINLFNSNYKNNYDAILDADEGYHTFYTPYFQDLKNTYTYSRNLNLSQTILHFKSIGYSLSSIYTINLTNDGWIYATLDALSKKDNLSLLPAPLGSAYKEKGYFVNLLRSNNTSLSINKPSEVCSIFTHFNNSGNLESYNDVTCRYSFNIDSLNSSDKSYSVIFSINNISYEVLEHNGKFNFTISSHDFGLNADVNYPITIAGFDSNGNQIRQNLFSFPYKKPNDPKDTAVNKVKITNETAIYKSYISDVDLDKNKLGVGESYISSPELSWDKLKGEGITLLAVNKNIQGLHSNIVKFKYYPVADLSTDFVSQDKKLNKLIQLNNVVPKVKIYFKPISKPSFIGSFQTMYLRAGRDLLAYIIYDPRYAGNIFYVSYNSYTYSGVFQNSSKYASDSSPYFLSKLRDSLTIQND